MFISFLPAPTACYNLALAQIPFLRRKNWEVSQLILWEKFLDPGGLVSTEDLSHYPTSNEKHPDDRARPQVRVQFVTGDLWNIMQIALLLPSPSPSSLTQKLLIGSLFSATQRAD